MFNPKRRAVPAAWSLMALASASFQEEVRTQQISTGFSDCGSVVSLAQPGPFAPVEFRGTHNRTDYFGFYIRKDNAADETKFPLLVFAHGLTGQWEMYAENLRLVASHGFAVVFPFIESPEEDEHPSVKSTDGSQLIKGANIAAAMREAGSFWAKDVDLDNVVFAGHSMGATATIMGAKRYLDGKRKATTTQETAKRRDYHSNASAAGEIDPDPPFAFAVKGMAALHPGVCGPLGPPPWPSTWMKNDLRRVIYGENEEGGRTDRIPVLLVTAENDGAFWPAPYTFEFERGCFEKAARKGTKHDFGSALFLGFNEGACIEDNSRKPDFSDSGHNCCLKRPEANPEFRWLLAFAKLHAQNFTGQRIDMPENATHCYELLYGDASESVRNSETVKHVDVVLPEAEVVADIVVEEVRHI